MTWIISLWRLLIADSRILRREGVSATLNAPCCRWKFILWEPSFTIAAIDGIVVDLQFCFFRLASDRVRWFLVARSVEIRLCDAGELFADRPFWRAHAAVDDDHRVSVSIFVVCENWNSTFLRWCNSLWLQLFGSKFRTIIERNCALKFPFELVYSILHIDAVLQELVLLLILQIPFLQLFRRY